MIPGLFSRRLLGGVPPSGIVSAPAYQQLLAYGAGVSSASATATFNINPNGTWNSSGTGYGTKSGLWFNPATVGAGNSYEVRLTPTLTSGSGAVVSNQASTWVALSDSRQLQAVLNRYTSGTSSVGYSIKVEIRLTGGAIVSTGTFQLGINVDVDAGIGGGSPGCPTLDMEMEDGRFAEAVSVGDLIALFNPETGEEIQGEVVFAETELQPCVQLTAANGATLKCSASAPLATTSGEVKAPGLLGMRAWMKVDGMLDALVVTDVRDIGQHLVRHITVRARSGDTRWADRYFFVGVSGTLWLHHNAKMLE